MKKIIGLLITVFLLSNCNAFANYIDIQPTMFSKSNAQDRVWVGTFQLVWNDFINKIVFNPVRFREGTPIFVYELNKQTFKDSDISDSCYYKYAGKVKKNTKKTISKAIRKKFKESSDILDKLDINPRNDMYLIYAMLKKDFEFLNAFDKLERSIFKSDDIAEYFGIDANSDNELRKGVNVLFYDDIDDFAVKLTTTGNDEVYIYKNPSNKPFNLLYIDMLKKEKSYIGDKHFNKVDELKIPNIKFSEVKIFDELANKRIMGTNLVINQAVETIIFDMNNKGVKLKSEAAMTTMTTALIPEKEPRLFHCNNTFVIFLKEKNKRIPYFALRVNDIKKFQ